MNNAFLIPKPGLRIRDPITLALLPPQGAQMPLSVYWLRRIHDGDVFAGKTARAELTKPTKRAAASGAQE